MASAQIWVPAAGLAALLLLRAWLGGVMGGAQMNVSAGYFLSLGLAIILPVAACVIVWAWRGGPAQWGPILLLETASTGERHFLLAALLSPTLAFLIARFIFASADGAAYAAATAGAFALAMLLPPPAVLAAALGIGGLVGFADRVLGKTPIAMASATAFALLFGYVYAKGGAAIPLIALGLVGGLCLSLLAAAGRRAKTPLYMLLALLPAFALAAAVKDASALDLSAHMPEPAIGTYGALLILFAVFPAVAAPFVTVLIWLGDGVRAFLGVGARAWAAPFALLVELILGIVLSGVLALALAAGGALFNHLHETMGGATVLNMSALIAQIRPSPLAASSAWLIGLLVLPPAVAVVHMIACATRLFGKLLAASGLGKALWQSGWGMRLLATCLWRALQLLPTALILLAIIGLASIAPQRYGHQLAQAADALALVGNRAAHGIEDWRL